MKKTIRLTESELKRIVMKVLKEEQETTKGPIDDCFRSAGLDMPNSCIAYSKKFLKNVVNKKGITDIGESWAQMGNACVRDLAVTSIKDPLGIKKAKVLGCLLKYIYS